MMKSPIVISWLKVQSWKLLGPLVARLTNWYASDSRYASDTSFNIVWAKAGILLQSSSQPLRGEANPDLMSYLAKEAHRSGELPAWQVAGFNLLPFDYMSPIPNLRELQSGDQPPFDHQTLALDPEQQLHLLTALEPWRPECRFPLAQDPEHPDSYYLDNGYFGPVDAQILYSIIRWARPRSIIEVGSGHTTRLMSKACQRNDEETGTITNIQCIDPHPRADIQSLPQVTAWHEIRVEKLEPDLFRELGRDDVLVIDSSHVVRTGGDVIFLFLRVLPILKPGVLVHIHDICLPEDYPTSSIVDEGRYWTEQYLLHAFMLFNSEFEFLWSSQTMTRLFPDALRNAFGDVGGTSTWIRRRSGDADN